MHELENKWVAEWVPRKCLKRKGGFLPGKGWGEFQDGNGGEGRRKGWFGAGAVDNSRRMVP
jgi:hypothetical protein